MSRLHRTAAATGLMAAVAALAFALPAQAAPHPAAARPAWHVAFRHQYEQAFGGYLTVVAPGKGDAWALGGAGAGGGLTTGTPVAAHLSGGKWRAAALPAGLSGTIAWASASSPRDVWAIVGLGEDVVHFNGSHWYVARRFPSTAELTGVTALSPADVWLFGAPGFEQGLGTWHFDGRTWTHVVSGAATGIDTASALSPRDIWAIGSARSPQDSVVHYNGKRWQRVRAPALAGASFNDILALSPASVWVVGDHPGGQAPHLLLHFNGKSWSRVRMPGNGRALRIASDGAGGFWVLTNPYPPAAGNRETLLHRSRSGTWTGSSFSPAAGAGLSGLTVIPGSAALWGAGEIATKTGTEAAVYARGSAG